MWIPKTLDELTEMLGAQEVAEGDHLDFKAAFSGNNQDLAVDMAAMAPRGGVLIIGVGEDKSSGSFVRRPIDLKGSREKVVEVANSHIQPRLEILTHTIEDTAEERQRGYLVIVVPPSAVAPHMVDGRYRARSDATNRFLSDREVRELLAPNHSKAGSEPTFRSGEWPESGFSDAHILVTAQPKYASRSQLQKVLGHKAREWVSQRTRDIRANAVQARGLFNSGSQQARRHGAWCVEGDAFDRAGLLIPDANENARWRFAVHEDGRIAFWFGGLGFIHPTKRWKLIPSWAVQTSVRAVVRLAEEAGVEMQYSGPWVIRVTIANVAGSADYDAWRGIATSSSNPVGVSEDYNHFIEVFAAQLKDHSSIEEELIGPFLRDLADTKY